MLYVVVAVVGSDFTAFFGFFEAVDAEFEGGFVLGDQTGGEGVRKRKG